MKLQDHPVVKTLFLEFAGQNTVLLGGLTDNTFKGVSYGDAYAQQNIKINLFTQHVSEIEQDTQRVICRVIIK